MPQAPPSDTAVDRLNPLLESWVTDASAATFNAIVQELFDGSSELLLPVEADDATDGSMRLACVFDVEGTLVMGAFSTEEGLYAWAGNKIDYTRMPTQEVLDFCQSENIGRLVINANQPNMFVLEREMPADAAAAGPETQIRIGPLKKPLPKKFIRNLSTAFAQIPGIEAAFAFGQFFTEQATGMIGLHLSEAGEETTAAIQEAFRKASEGVKMPLPVSMMAIPNDEWLELLHNMAGARFYTKSSLF